MEPFANNFTELFFCEYLPFDITKRTRDCAALIHKNPFTGFARASFTQIVNMGQEGFTDPWDPRYALTFLDTGKVSELNPSYVTGCAFVNSLSTAIGVYGAEGIPIQDNLIHSTLGDGKHPCYQVDYMATNKEIFVYKDIFIYSP